MQCKLIAVSKPAPDVDASTAEELVAYCARVSNPANQAAHASAPKLIRYLINNDHWSPLEMVHVTIEINTTRDIARQILRHRSFSFQEFSQRYAEVVDFAEPREARLQDHKNRQNSIDIDDEALQDDWEYDQKQVVDLADKVYRRALGADIAKEVARAVLPEGLTSSRLYMAGTLRSWIHYCKLRRGNGTQKEHMEIADECWRIICQEFPSITGLFKVDPLEQMVDDFRDALLERLRLRSREGKSGWEQDDWRDWCLAQMEESAIEGDPLDTAGYAAFAHYHKWGNNG